METKGLPLDFILSSLDKEKYVVDWVDFIQTSLKHNWKIKGTFIKIENALIDVFGREYSNSIIERLEMYLLYIENKEKN